VTTTPHKENTMSDHYLTIQVFSSDPDDGLDEMAYDAIIGALDNVGLSYNIAVNEGEDRA
jgi:hypothetical protein